MAGTNEWNEDLCGCTDDCGTCCYGFWCTPCLFGSNAEKIDGKNCLLMCCAYWLLANCYLCWVPHMLERKKLRDKYNLNENPACGDCPTTLCCGPCALCQEAREMKIREKNPGPTSAPQLQGPPAVVMQPMSQMKDFSQGNMQY